MKIIVVSDTHGSYRNFKAVMELSRNADLVVHCGDSRGELDRIMEEYPSIRFCIVKGNCDFNPDLAIVTEFTAEGVRFMATHGHIYNVKYDLYQLDCAARERNADVVLFGHTHIPADVLHDGVRFFNPGSLGYDKTYGVIEVKDGQVLSNLATLP
ncbi:metallophosphoesterase [Ruminococcus sp.]|uniref:metallophosphoesterase n=1 Tax=Ruminococcus sp. TaxID=41978 RepID=UPI00388D81A3